MDRTAAKSIIGKVDIKSTQDIDKILPYCLGFYLFQLKSLPRLQFLILSTFELE